MWPDAAHMLGLVARAVPEENPPRPLYLRAADAKRLRRDDAVTARAIALREAPPPYAPLLAELHAQSFAERWAEAAFASFLPRPASRRFWPWQAST